MIKTCSYCEKEFEAVRGTAKYCSDKCKKAFQRVSGTNDLKISGTNLNGTKKVPASFDDKYSPKYDLSEEGFIRRNKSWGDFSERFRTNRRADAKKIKERIANDMIIAQKQRDSSNSLANTPLAPKE